MATLLPPLEDLLGPLPTATGNGADLAIHESAANVHPYSAGDLAPTDGRIRVSEAFDDPAAIALPLARTWFGPASPIDSPWLREGLAAWVAYDVLGQPCPAPAPYPQAAPDHYGDPDLDGRWYMPSAATPQRGWDYWDWQHSTACGVVRDAADIIGPEAMSAVIAQLTNGPDEATVGAWVAALSAHEPPAGPSVADILAADFAAAGIDSPPAVIEPVALD